MSKNGQMKSDSWYKFIKIRNTKFGVKWKAGNQLLSAWTYIFLFFRNLERQKYIYVCQIWENEPAIICSNLRRVLSEVLFLPLFSSPYPPPPWSMGTSALAKTLSFLPLLLSALFSQGIFLILDGFEQFWESQLEMCVSLKAETLPTSEMSGLIFEFSD